MRDAFINSINTQKNAIRAMDAISENLVNNNLPGYRENQVSFKTYLDNAIQDKIYKNTKQGKAIPGLVKGNVFLEGNAYFVLRNEKGAVSYTRFGEFNFDGEGVYRSSDGSKVQGYLLDDKGEIMNGASAISTSVLEEAIAEGGALAVPTTEIKLWKDPDNGKYLGQYNDFEIKGDGILYGKTEDGNSIPLYKLALMSFHNPQGLFEFQQGQFVETGYSGKPLMGKAEVRSDYLEASNVDFRRNTMLWQETQTQIDLSGQVVSQYKDLLQTMMKMIE